MESLSRTNLYTSYYVTIGSSYECRLHLISLIRPMVNSPSFGGNEKSRNLCLSAKIDIILQVYLSLKY